MNTKVVVQSSSVSNLQGGSQFGQRSNYSESLFEFRKRDNLSHIKKDTMSSSYQSNTSQHRFKNQNNSDIKKWSQNIDTGTVRAPVINVNL